VFELSVKTGFAAAHRLRGYQGKCESLHGHNWKVEVVLEGAKLNELGMVMDFSDVKRLLRDIVADLDHQYLNDLPPFAETNPTTEGIARFISERLAGALPQGVRVKSVTCWESDDCSATYRSGD